MIPDLLEWWVPLGVAAVVCSVFAWRAWRRREYYPVPLIVFHFFYLGWCTMRGMGAMLTASYLDTSTLVFRLILFVVAPVLVALSFSIAKARERNDRDRRDFMEGPAALWSPEPVVGYRFTIHSWHMEPYTGQRAECRYGALRHSIADVPTWGCCCGFYAYKSPMMVQKSFPGEFAVVVFMWGRVLEHERGYRSEYMRPIGYYKRRPVDDVYFRGFYDLPVARTEQELNTLIEKARREFDAAAPPPYDGGYYGYRTTHSQD